MRHLILAMVFTLLVGTTAARAQQPQLEDFGAIARAIGKEVSIVDSTGRIREGIVEAATADAVTLRFGSTIESLPRATVASAERMKDDSSDGAFKGAAWALLLVLLPNQGWTSSRDFVHALFMMPVVGAGVGYVFDAMETTRQPLYRAPAPSAAPAPMLRISLRF